MSVRIVQDPAVADRLAGLSRAEISDELVRGGVEAARLVVEAEPTDDPEGQPADE